MEARSFRQIFLSFCFLGTVSVNAFSVEVGSQGAVFKEKTPTSVQAYMELFPSYWVAMPTLPPLTCDPTPIELSFCDENGQPRSFHSNLAGKGPDSGKSEFRIYGVAVVGGTTLDLVLKVATDSTYQSWRQDNPTNPNGAGAKVDTSCMAALPIEVRTSTKFDWMLVKHDDPTDQPYNVNQLRLSIADFDQETTQDHEYVLLNTPAFSMTKGSNVDELILQTGTRKLQSVVTGKTSDNPTGLTLSADQVKKTVELGYKNVSSWYLTFGHEGGSSSRDRVFFFAGSIVSPCPIHYSLCDVHGKPRPYHSNIGGKGPDSGKSEFRIYGVGTVGSITLDLVLKVATDSTYQSWRQDNPTNPNGAGAYVDTGCRAAIPIEVRTSTKFQWMFVKHDDQTDQPFDMNQLKLSILDFDQETNQDHEYVLLNTPSSEVQKGSNVHELVQDGIIKLQSVVEGKTSDNPTGLTLTADQVKKTADITYNHVSSWYLTFGHEGGSSSRDRVFFFAPSFSSP